MENKRLTSFDAESATNLTLSIGIDCGNLDDSLKFLGSLFPDWSKLFAVTTPVVVFG
jgi:hypothetical protein